MKPGLFLLVFVTTDYAGRVGASGEISTDMRERRFVKRVDVAARSSPERDSRSTSEIESSRQQALPSPPASRTSQGSNLPAIGVDPHFRTRLLRATTLEPFAIEMNQRQPLSRRERRRLRHRKRGRFLCCLTALTCMFLGGLAYDRCHETSNAAQVRLTVASQLDQRLLVLNEAEKSLTKFMQKAHAELAKMHGPAQQRQGAALAALEARLAARQHEAQELAGLIKQLKDLETRPWFAKHDEGAQQRLRAAIKSHSREDMKHMDTLQTEMFRYLAEANKNRQAGHLLSAQNRNGVIVGIPRPESSTHR